MSCDFTALFYVLLQQIQRAWVPCLLIILLVDSDTSSSSRLWEYFFEINVYVCCVVDSRHVADVTAVSLGFFYHWLTHIYPAWSLPICFSFLKNRPGKFIRKRYYQSTAFYLFVATLTFFFTFLSDLKGNHR